MTDQTYNNLASIVSVTPQKYSWGTVQVISYTSPKHSDPDKEFTIRVNEKTTAKDLLEKVKALTSGETVTLTTKKNEKGFSDLVGVGAASEAHVTTSKPAYSSSSGKTSSYTKSTYVPKDETGIAVGAAYTNAIEIIKLGGEDYDSTSGVIGAVDRIARAVLKNKLKLEAELRAQKSGAVPQTEAVVTKPAMAKKTASAPKLNKMPAEEDIITIEDDFDNFDLDDIE